MNTIRIDQLKQEYDFDHWQDTNTLDQELLVWRLHINGGEMPNWALHSVQYREAAEWPRTVETVWLSPEVDLDQVLILNIYECASRLAAHEFLLHLVDGFQSTEVSRRTQMELGDAAFSVPEEFAILFARANVVASLANGGDSLVRVTGIAAMLDDYLSASAQRQIDGGGPEIRRIGPDEGKLAVGVFVPLVVDAIDPEGHPLSFKFYSDTGDFRVDDGRPMYRPTSSGAQLITVYVTDIRGNSVEYEIDFEVQ